MAIRLTVGEPNAGTLYELDAIAATLIGGTTFDGGVGGVHGTVLGILILAFLSNVLNLLNISPYSQMLLKGVIIILAVVVSEWRKRSEEHTSELQSLMRNSYAVFCLKKKKKKK